MTAVSVFGRPGLEKTLSNSQATTDEQEISNSETTNASETLATEENLQIKLFNMINFTMIHEA